MHSQTVVARFMEQVRRVLLNMLEKTQSRGRRSQYQCAQALRCCCGISFAILKLVLKVFHQLYQLLSLSVIGFKAWGPPHLLHIERLDVFTHLIFQIVYESLEATALPFAWTIAFF